MRRLAWDWFVDTLVAGAIIVLLAAATMGCQSTVTIDGQEFTALLSMDHARQVLEEQTAHVEHASALDLARNQRLVGWHPAHGLLLGPEVDPSTLLEVAARPQMPMPGPVRDQATGTGIWGADNRDWPWWGPTAGGVPNGSNAMFAYDAEIVGQPPAEPVGSSGAPACSGTMVYGRSSSGGFLGPGAVAVTAGHCIDRWTEGDSRNYRFHRGWTLPYNRQGRYVDGTAFVCVPAKWIPAGYSVYHNTSYDIAVFDWRSSWCSPTDMQKRPVALGFQSVEQMVHVGQPADWSFQFTNWGAPGTGTGTCGPRADTRPATETGSSSLPYWPTACGMRAWGSHIAGSAWAESFDVDTKPGHSGGPWFTNWGQGDNGATTALVGVHRGVLQCPLTCNDRSIATVRSSWNESFLQAAGVW